MGGRLIVVVFNGMASMILMEITSPKKVGMSMSGGVQWLMRLAGGS